MKELLGELEGVVSAEVDFEKGLGKVLYKPGQADIAAIEDVIRRAGYHPKILKQTPVDSGVIGRE